MSKILPSLKPFPKILPLYDFDETLISGVDTVCLPPKDLNEQLLLHHTGTRQAVYIGTHILAKFLKNFPQTDNHLPVARLYRHLLDVGDSIGTLVRFGSAPTATILLRTLFETMLSLEFILQGNRFHKERAESYWACYKIKKLESCLTTDPSTEAGRQFYQLFDHLPDIPSLSHLDRVQQLHEERTQHEKELGEGYYKNYWERYQAAKKNKRPREWYALSSSARNLRELARLVGREGEYLFLYQAPSEIVHATDVITGVFRLDQRGCSISQARGPTDKIGKIARLSIFCLIEMHERMLNTYLLNDKKIRKLYKKWHISFGRYYLWAMKEAREELEDMARILPTMNDGEDKLDLRIDLHTE